MTSAAARSTSAMRRRRSPSAWSQGRRHAGGRRSMVEPRMDGDDVGRPSFTWRPAADTNVLFMTVMANLMPFVGRGKCATASAVTGYSWRPPSPWPAPSRRRRARRKYCRGSRAGVSLPCEIGVRPKPSAMQWPSGQIGDLAGRHHRAGVLLARQPSPESRNRPPRPRSAPTP